MRGKETHMCSRRSIFLESLATLLETSQLIGKTGLPSRIHNGWSITWANNRQRKMNITNLKTKSCKKWEKLTIKFS